MAIGMQSFGGGDRIRMNQSFSSERISQGDTGEIVCRGSLPCCWTVRFDRGNMIENVHEQYMQRLSPDYRYRLPDDFLVNGGGVIGYDFANCTSTVSSNQYNPTKTKRMSSLSEKFALAITPEPQKSFRKAGITNGDNILTDEGMKIFLTWLLGKNADEFKTAVVDGILAEQKEQNRC